MIAVTSGDPCGIGPEVILKSLAMARVGRVVVIGDLRVFEQAARRLRRRLPPWRVWSPGQPWPEHGAVFLHCPSAGRFRPGRSSAAAGAAALSYLRAAVALWRSGHLRALVTAPVTKWAIARVEPGFIGQTEWLTRAMRARGVVMMFASARMRVVVLTRHVPLVAVSHALTRGLIETAIRQTAQALRRQFGIARPRLAVCGLNPHAGEQARCGREEQRIMEPALRHLRRSGVRCDGPFAADGFFAAGRAYDAVICPYHDQGLIPFKMVARDHGCQVSLGLPIARTSPDHGSALDIAGQGIANPGSMRYALRLAATLSLARG